MQVRIFSLSFEPGNRGFNDAELRDFMKDVEVISVSDHLLIRNETPYLVLILKYNSYAIGSSPVQGNQPRSRDKPSEPWKTLLTDADTGLFNLLREWRAQRCRKDGLPPYVLFTNVQLAQITKARPQSLADLSKIEGVGQSKCDRYGAELLSITQLNRETPEPVQVHGSQEG